MPHYYHIDYSSAIKAVAARHNRATMLSREALKLINELLQDLNFDIVNSCCRCKDKNNPPLVLRDAVDKITLFFPNLLRRHAHIEANKCLTKFRCNLLQYNYEPAHEKERRLEHQRLLRMNREREELGQPPLPNEYPPSFSRGLDKLVMEADSHVRMHPHAKRHVNAMLTNFTMDVAEKAKEHARAGQRLTAAEVMKALDAILPDELLQHARSEGMRGVLHLQSGLIKFAPKGSKKKRGASEAASSPPSTPKALKLRKGQ